MASPTEPRNFSLILILIALAAAVPRFLLGASQYIEYDGYWHVFIAQQDNWGRFWSEIYANAHPPLYFLLLKAAIWFGHSPLIYRSISIISGLFSVFLVGWIARKITTSEVWAYLAALAYGLALPGIIISVEVRSYMLSALFVLWSFLCLTDLILQENPARRARYRAGFTLGAIFACLSHYYAFFYAGAAVLLLFGRFVFRKYRRKPADWKAEAATLLPVVAVIYALYRTHAGRLATIQGHLLPYYYKPGGNETVPSFLLRNWKNLINLFSPWPVSGDAAALGLLAGGLIATVVFLFLPLRKAEAPALGASLTVLITAITVIAMATAAVAGKYPFGGDLRQQYLLFPFVVLCAAICADQVTDRLRANSRVWLGVALATAVVWVSVLRFEQYPKVSGRIGQDRMDAFNSLAPDPAAVYLDQFNLILFFIHHHQWQWSSVRVQPPIPGIDVYRLRLGSRQIQVFRDQTEWNVDPDDSGFYHTVLACLRAEKIPEISAFNSRQSPPKDPFSNLRQVSRLIVTEAASAPVCVQKINVNAIGWYASFRESNCRNLDIPPLRFSGAFDDSAEEVQYAGAWTHGSYSPAANGTVSFSNSSGSAAQIRFDGKEITYVYTQAFNRGIAAIKIDGHPRGEIDLYALKTGWQSRATFSGLAPGRHTFEVEVTGRKDAAATDRYVDLDALIVR